LIGTCLLVGGIVQAMLPGERFSIAWRHSVEKTRWEERYVVSGDRLVLEESRVEAFGAGMEPAEGARLVDGSWRWVPRVAPLPEVRLTLSPYTEDYTVCWAGRCAPLHTLVHAPDIATVTLTPCAG
jgi:hypothetical protein